jgi:single-strand DNA-binding protein
MWLTVVAWDKLASRVSEVVKKGSLVLVAGRLSVRSYTDKNNVEKQAVEVTAHTVQALPKPNGKAKSQPEEVPEAVE